MGDNNNNQWNKPAKTKQNGWNKDVKIEFGRENYVRGDQAERLSTSEPGSKPPKPK